MNQIKRILIYGYWESFLLATHTHTHTHTYIYIYIYMHIFIEIYDIEFGCIWFILCHINHCRLANVKSVLHIQAVLFQTIRFGITTHIFIFTHLNVKTFLFQAIQLSVITQFSFILPIDWTLSGASTPGQSGPWNNGNKGVLYITVAIPLYCLVSYPWHLLGKTHSPQKCGPCIILQHQLTGPKLP